MPEPTPDSCNCRCSMVHIVTSFAGLDEAARQEALATVEETLPHWPSPIWLSLQEFWRDEEEEVARQNRLN